MSGSKPQQPQFVQPPPPQIIQGPQPNVAETSNQLAQSQLQYNPQLTAQAVQLQQQYGLPLAQNQANIQTQLAPQLARSQYDIQAQYGPLYRALFENLFPTQTQGLETLAQQANQRLAAPFSLTPQQQSAQDAIRNRQRDELSRSIRGQANLGGNLYSGSAQDRETRAQAELANQYAMSDIGLQQQNRAQTLQELIAAGQVVFPQVQQPGVPQAAVPQYGQSATPSPDTLLQALQQSYIINPAQFQQGTPGSPSFLGSFARGYGGVGF